MVPSARALSGGVTAQRFEMKYILGATQAEIVRQSILPFVRPDPKAKFGPRYDLSSVYLDSPKLDLFWASNLGEAKRFKLRVRTYTEAPGDPVFFEIKGRYNGIVIKKRATVRRPFLRDILEGHPVGREALVDPENTMEAENLQLFRAYQEQVGATPRLHVRYTREAYMSLDDDPVRMTLDDDIACLPANGQTDNVRMNGRGWRALHDPVTILEIKFTNSYPCWVQDLVQQFSLRRDSFAKYVQCVHLLRREGYDIKGGAHVGFTG